PFEVIGPADRRSLGDGRVRDERALDLGGTDAMTGDVQDVVDAAHDPVVAVLVAPRAVAGEVAARDIAEVLLPEALVVAPPRAEHRGPGLLQPQHPAVPRGHGRAVLLYNVGDNAKHWQPR